MMIMVSMLVTGIIQCYLSTDPLVVAQTHRRFTLQPADVPARRYDTLVTVPAWHINTLLSKVMTGFDQCKTRDM